MSTNQRSKRQKRPISLRQRLLPVFLLVGLFVSGFFLGMGSPVEAQGGAIAGSAVATTQFSQGQQVKAQYLPNPPNRPEQDPDAEEGSMKINPLVPIGDVTRRASVGAPVPVFKPTPREEQTGPGAQSNTSTISFLRNAALGNAGHAGQTSRINEPSEASAGNVVIYTGNWYASISTNGGQTFQYINPYTTFPASFGGFCCDQTVHYAPSVNLFIWQLQYSRDGAGNNIQRIAVATPAQASVGNWWYWDVPSSAIGAGTWFDFPGLAIGANSLYMTTNRYNNASPAAWQGTGIYRIGLADLADRGGLGWTSWHTTQNFNFRVADYTGTRAVWASHNSTSQLRIYWWDEGSNTINWNGGTNLSRSWNNSNYSSITPDGFNWLGRVDPRIIGATVRGNEAWFAWTVGRGGGASLPHPYVEVAVVDMNTQALIAQHAIWNGDHAWAYPGLATNSLGEVGASLGWGGNLYNPNHAVGYLTGTWRFVTTAVGTNGPNNNTWGDYLAVRKHYPQQWLFSASGWTSQGGGGNGNSSPTYTVFGRTDEIGDAYEMDDTVQEAKFIGLNSTQNRSIHFPTDIDYVKFTVSGYNDVDIATNGGTTADTRLYLYNSAGALVEYDDDDGPGNYSFIHRVALPAGTYTLLIDEYGQNTAIPAYSLSVNTTPRTYYLAPDSLTVNEGAGTATVNVRRTGDASVAASVGYYTLADSAVDGSDYTGNSSVVTLNFAAGESSKPVSIPLLSNAVLEGTERFYIVLNGPTLGTLGSPSFISVFINDNAAAPAPTNVVATILNASSIRVAWTDNCANETGFGLERSTDGGATWSAPVVRPALGGTGGATNYTFAGLPNGYYVFRVRALGALGNSNYTLSNTVHLSPPAAPSGLTITILNGTTVTLNWIDNSDNEIGFRIYRWDNVSNAYSLVNTRPANTVTWTNGGLVPGRRYIYYVQAYNNAGAAISAKVAVTMPTTPLAPSGLTATILSPDVRLNWVDNSNNETGFRIYRWDSVSNVYSLLTTRPANTVTYLDAGLVSGRKYIYYVQAYNLAGVANSAKVSVTMP
jgi:hypothetical protein